MTDAALRIVPAADAGWPAVEAVILAEATSRDCWCQFHVLTNAEWRATTRASRRELLHEQIDALEPARGLVALRGDDPIGWCGVEPRSRVRHALASRLVAKESPSPADDAGVWMVYCLLVPKPARGQGVAGAMLAAAIAHALEHGATAVEGLPIDASARAGKGMAGFSTGTLAMFEREGFRAVAALPSGRTLVRLETGA